MASGPQWHGFDRERDLPMLGIDPHADRKLEVVDDGRRPDNRDPEMAGYGLLMVGREPSGVGYEESVDRPGEGQALLSYHRDLALAYNVARASLEVAEVLA